MEVRFTRGTVSARLGCGRINAKNFVPRHQARVKFAASAEFRRMVRIFCGIAHVGILRNLAKFRKIPRFFFGIRRNAARAADFLQSCAAASRVPPTAPTAVTRLAVAQLLRIPQKSAAVRGRGRPKTTDKAVPQFSKKSAKSPQNPQKIRKVREFDRFRATGDRL